MATGKDQPECFRYNWRGRLKISLCARPLDTLAVFFLLTSEMILVPDIQRYNGEALSDLGPNFKFSDNHLKLLFHFSVVDSDPDPVDR
jgi:hypothetical protein